MRAWRWARGIGAAGPHSRPMVGRQPRVPAQADPLDISSAKIARRPFVVADYDQGRLGDVPVRCPWGSLEAPCDVVVHGLRARKTGPTHPLAVCRCHVHDVAFSAYPPGFVPYARRTLLTEASPGGAPSVEDVARDASNGIAWSRTSAGGSDRWWSTQGRILDQTVEAAGLGTSSDVRDAVAVATGLPVSLLAQGAQAGGYRQRGTAVLAVIAGLGANPLERLLLAGALADCWGVPWRWDREPPRLRCLVPPELRTSPIRSTTSGRRVPPPDW